jgi:hypothetical protein
MSEFELANYRQNPRKFYSELVSDAHVPDLTALGTALRDFEQSAIMKNVRTRTLSGQPPDPEQIEEVRRHIQELMNEHPMAKESIESKIGLSKDRTRLSLHKSWHCLHFVLTGQNRIPPESLLAKAIMGGTEIPDQAGVMGYGPARYLSSGEVQQIAEELAAFPIEERVQVFDSQIANQQEIYSPNHGKEELLHYFELLRDFYRDAASKHHAMVLWIE